MHTTRRPEIRVVTGVIEFGRVGSEVVVMRWLVTTTIRRPFG